MSTVTAISSVLTLGELLGAHCPRGLVERVVSGLRDDSRQVTPGDLFFARSGAHVEGVRFARDAMSRGAAGVVVPAHMADAARADLPDGAPLIPVPDVLEVMASAANRFHADPLSDLRLVGVTGTNGKTSVARFIAGALATVTGPVGKIGTLGVTLMDRDHERQLAETVNTTPGTLALFEALAAIRDAGARYAVMEVSSHALTQRRLAGVPLEVGVFTNLSRDHLDYHGDLESYFEAKALLFTHPGLREAVINMDDRHGRILLERFGDRLSCWAFGLGDAPWEAGDSQQVHATDLRYSRDGLALSVETGFGSGSIQSPLFGAFNASNLLAALAALLALGMPQDQALAALGQVPPPPGRMQRLRTRPGQPQVIVDYAHTPDALEQVLVALRGHVVGRLHCIFGCGGERDPGKRPQMGAVAEGHADRVVVTDDNPRTEPGEIIVAQILSGMRAPDEAIVQRDRRLAIVETLAAAAADDLVLIAGKGHEDYQEIDGQRLPFSDIEVARHWVEGQAA
ncbi:MAG: UDP-N-acetylmuramoyl-L-alanyl-D-glutamate--2,6-diaminopimelate ligase [Halothiobacillaceae bacterium]